MMIQRIREILSYRQFLAQIVFNQISNRYQGSLLGFAWTLLNPIIIYISFTLVFATINRVEIKSFAVYFFAGFTSWNFFQNSCFAAAESILGNPQYVTRIYAPRVIFPVASVVMFLVDFLVFLGILIPVMLILGAPITPALLFVPFSLIIWLVFVTGAALFCATVNVIFRDFRQLLSAFLLIAFFFSPVLWSLEFVTERVRTLAVWNPMVPMLKLFQDPIYAGVVPSMETVLISCALALVSLYAGLSLFNAHEKRFYYYL